jgi:hypothetical protein
LVHRIPLLHVRQLDVYLGLRDRHLPLPPRSVAPRQIYERPFDAVDRINASEDIWATESAQRIDGLPLNEWREAQAPKIKQRSAGGLIFKTRDNALQSTPQADEEFERRVDHLISPCIGELGEIVAEAIGRLERRHAAEIAELRAEIEQLRGEHPGVERIRGVRRTVLETVLEDLRD